ncbi:MAG: Ig-like domain-containing protein [Gemmatimonadaceae bacterium]
MTGQDSVFPRMLAVLEFVRQRQVARRLAFVLMLAAAACTVTFEPPASRIAPVEGNNQFGLAGLALVKPLSVKLTDSFLNPIAGVPVRFDIVAGGGTIAGVTTTTSAAGIATSGAWTLGSRGHSK